MNDNASELSTSLPCPDWCAHHKVDADDPSHVVEHVETHNAETFALRSAEDRPSLVAATLSAMVVDGDPWDPQIGLHTRPESPDTVPAGLSVRQARMLGEALLRFAEHGESLMTEPCKAEGCDRMTVPSSEGLCDPCRMDAWRARQPRLVKL